MQPRASPRRFGVADRGPGDRDDHAARIAGDHFELVALRDCSLVNVPADDELGAGVDQRREHVRAARDRLLPAAPGSADHLVVQRDTRSLHPRVRRCELRRRAFELRVAHAAGLVAPRPDRIEADDVCARADELGSVVSHCARTRSRCS